MGQTHEGGRKGLHGVNSTLHTQMGKRRVPNLQNTTTQMWEEFQHGCESKEQGVAQKVSETIEKGEIGDNN